MTHDPLEHATRLLRDAVDDTGEVDRIPPDRDDTVARIAEALRDRRRRDRIRRRWIGVGMAAGVLALVGTSVALVVRQVPSPVTVQQADHDRGRIREASDKVTVLHDGQTSAPAAGARLADGTELRTPLGAEAHLDFDSGTQLTIAGGTRVRLVEQTHHKRFALEAGSVFAKVAKLSADERFVVTTSDAEIEVRGTAFRVTLATPDPSCENGTPTRLDVTEGTVVVRHAAHEVRVAAGEHWPACANAPVAGDAPRAPAKESKPLRPVAVNTISTGNAGAPTSAVGPAAMAPTALMAAKATVADAPNVSPERASHLAEQNDLFDTGMQKKRAGDLSGALATFERLIAAYPEGPLGENASVERMRVLGSLEQNSHPVRAAAAARDYLARYPSGFAREEARKLSVEQP
ncbi:hypothetical protein AKJ09_08940 [Labilithrix luteola]|uniref:FecR protein domain-containing protein n=1 Tax=Labilithrix luteola TaxID=1391654 RepID=A0A0K1Q9E2_9BACT|nr:FecR family protein [Labilithrix luteola]AKV02277.1 hypothetical protein AKJ09_08940 [Labilithrix luteola]